MSQSRERVTLAFEAMKAIGISLEVVKPVLKNLVKLYDNNWELIEDENYRALADAIFEDQESKEKESISTTAEKIDNEAFVNGSSSPPRTRLRSRQDTDHSSLLVHSSGIMISEPPSKRQKMDGSFSPQFINCQEEQGQMSSPVHVVTSTVSVLNPSLAKGKSPMVTSSLACTNGKRKRHVSLQPPSIDRSNHSYLLRPPLQEKRPVQERKYNQSCFKETKIEPGIHHGCKADEPNKPHSNIKCEPFIDDPQFEVPIAVGHPQLPCNTSKDQISKGGQISNSDIVQTHVLKSSPTLYIASRAEEEDNLQHKACQNGTSVDPADILETTAANFEIASSAHGEVKLLLVCNSNQTDFHMPNLDQVEKLVKDKYIRSSNMLEPKFSLKKLLQEICQCFLELGSANVKQEPNVNITPAVDFSKKLDLQNVLGATCDPLPGVNGLNGISSSKKRNQGASGHTEIEKDRRRSKRLKSANLNMQNSDIVPQCQSSFGDLQLCHDVNDIAKGEEKVKISLFNEVSSDQYPPPFHYIPRNMIYQNAYVNFSLARIGDDDCCSECFGDCLASSIPCACARETGGEYAYRLDGLIKKEFLDECISMNRDPEKHHHFYCKDCPLERSKNEDKPGRCKGHLLRKFIKECWSKCGCNKQCGNRVVQRGITRNLQVFFSSGSKGWGLRTLEELPRGTFVCEYVGEVLTNAELYNRNMQGAGSEKHHYPVLLDADWGAEGVLKDEEALCLDAKIYGNVARFINHRCFDATMVEIPVEVETPDHHYYHLAFFTTRRVEALEELTWDYGIDFDDHSHPVKAFQCLCGSKFCRDLKHSRGKSAKRAAAVRG